MQFNDYNHSAAPRYPLSNKIINGLSLKQSKQTSTDRRSSIQYVSKAAASKVIKSKENQECTFEPKTNSRGEKRSFDRFLKDQQIFLLVKQEKIQHLREEINKSTDEQNTRKPSIGSNSKHIAACTQLRDADNIFERLFKEKHVEAFTADECSFNPKILDRSKSLTRKMDISNLLYEDAKRRQEKQQHFKQTSMTTSPKINSNTNMLVGRKILTQFAELVTDDEMNPLIAISILEQIFNVDLNPNKNAANNLTVQKLLAFISEPTHCNSVLVSSQRLSAFITIAIGGVSQVKCFTGEQEAKIFEDFHYLYKERVTKQKKNSCPNILPFKPHTLAKSNKLAESFREKTCQQIDNFRGTQKININLKDGNYTIEDLFILDHVKRQAENEKKKIQKQNEELQKCTFKPNISSSFSLNVLKKKPKVTLKVPLRTRQSKIKTQQTQPTDYPQAQTNFSSKQGKNNPTDNSNEVSAKVSRCNSGKHIKDMEKAVMRMSVGRQHRQLSSTLQLRAYPEGENWNTLQRQMHRQSIQGNNILKGLMCQ